MNEFLYKGELVSAHHIAESEGVDYKLLWSRLKSGYSVEQAIKTKSPAFKEAKILMKAKLDSDCNQKCARDKAAFNKHAGFANCSARINSK